ncbi:MAG: tetratricopeptide repeat protein [Verrucomicrobiae bacterium]|nr:tetratricopeptide repeat protein [Verrucomicrobiae bacterium]
MNLIYFKVKYIAAILAAVFMLSGTVDAVQVNEISVEEPTFDQIVGAMRKQGVLVSSEKSNSFERGFLSKKQKFHFPGGDILQLCEKIVWEYPFVQFKYDEKTGAVVLLPREGAISERFMDAMKIKNESLQSVISKDEFGGKFNIKRKFTRRKYNYNLFFISMDFKGGVLREFLDSLCEAVGKGVCWSMEDGYNGSWMLEFIFLLPANELKSFKEVESIYDRPIDQRIIIYQDELKKTAEPEARAKLLMKLAVSNLEMGKVDEGKKMFDDAMKCDMELSQRWFYREFIIRYLYKLSDKKQGDMAVEKYDEIIKQCPVEKIKMNALSDKVFCLKSLGRKDAAIAELVKAYKDYPNQSMFIYEEMKSKFPEKIDLLPEPPKNKLLTKEDFVREYKLDAVVTNRFSPYTSYIAEGGKMTKITTSFTNGVAFHVTNDVTNADLKKQK